MSKSSPAAKAQKHANWEHYGAALEGFADGYGLTLKMFNNNLHWRLTDDSVTLDAYPSVGRYRIKDIPMGRGFGLDEQNGKLPHNYNELDAWLKALFGV